jgi:regulatory protein
MSSPYIDGLKMLGRRELSEAQVRQRLARKGHSADDIDDAVRRLKEERALDDARVADAIARTEIAIKRHGRSRVRRQIENAGIAPTLVKQAVDSAFGEIDDDALLQAALGRRLRGDRSIADRREFERLYRYLTAQGFESDRIVKALNARRGPASSDANDVE